MDTVLKRMLDTCIAIVLKLVDFAKKLQLFQQQPLLLQPPQQQQLDVPNQIGKGIIGVMMKTTMQVSNISEQVPIIFMK